MPDYVVIFDQTELVSSDAHVGTDGITAPVQAAKVAFVTAVDETAAKVVVGSVYNARQQDDSVVFDVTPTETTTEVRADTTVEVPATEVQVDTPVEDRPSLVERLKADLAEVEGRVV